MKPTMFLTQLLPLIVFIVVDALVTDVRISIASAILFAVGQLVFTWARSHRFDWFVLLDVGLICALGAVSLVSENDLFFKIKPAIIEAVTIAFMLALVLAPTRFLTGYYGRMMPGVPMPPEAVGRMKTMLGGMCVYVALHIAAVLYTAFYSSRATWAFVSGPGFYVILIPMGAVALVRVLSARRRGAAPGSAKQAARPPQ
jgi:intracellular septation protein A